MRILVTGISGQVGAAVADRFREFTTVVSADRAVFDLGESEQAIERKLDALACDVIVNPAAYTAVDRAEDDRDTAFRVNAIGPGVVARWAATHRVPLVHFSTDYVFDGSGERPWREDDPVGPLNVYGASKLAGEREVRAAGGAHLIVRASWIYSARGSNFLRSMMKLMREREEIAVVADQIGAPTTAADLAEALAQIVAPNVTDLPAAFAAASNTVHIAARQTTSWNGFAEAIRQALRERDVAIAAKRVVPIASSGYPTRAARPLNSRLDTSRLASVFGVEMRSWREALGGEIDKALRQSAGAPADGVC